jgi:alkanesulfonate monooxygenase SsuD/methylene tetrahydromethanopterin reductase-like flavin-dependent oxidoreductase (luciferase family)
MSFTLLRQGKLIAVPPPDQAMEFLAREARLTPSGDMPGRRGVVGSPETVRAGIETVASAYHADEVIVVTITYDHGVRRRSYELIAEAFDLEPRALAAETA